MRFHAHLDPSSFVLPQILLEGSTHDSNQLAFEYDPQLTCCRISMSWVHWSIRWITSRYVPHFGGVWWIEIHVDNNTIVCSFYPSFAPPTHTTPRCRVGRHVENRINYFVVAPSFWKFRLATFPRPKSMTSAFAVTCQDMSLPRCRNRSTNKVLITAS
jgi:hypothetical protein